MDPSVNTDMIGGQNSMHQHAFNVRPLRLAWFLSKPFLKLHSKAALQNSPEQFKALGTFDGCFLNIIKQIIQKWHHKACLEDLEPKWILKRCYFYPVISCNFQWSHWAENVRENPQGIYIGIKNYLVSCEETFCGFFVLFVRFFFFFLNEQTKKQCIFIRILQRCVTANLQKCFIHDDFPSARGRVANC